MALAGRMLALQLGQGSLRVAVCFLVLLLGEPSLNNTPAKAGGFELRTESPDTRRLNDASYSGPILKLSSGLGSK